MASLRLVTGDQLSLTLSALSDIQPDDRILMVEVQAETDYVPHHRQKLVFILSAMRHFADQLRQQGHNVDYVQLDDPRNTGSFSGEVKRALKQQHFERLIVTHPGEWRVLSMFQQWQTELGIAVEIREDDRFLSSLADFGQWAKSRKQLRMEYFYRQMRRQTGWLMEDQEPVGGQWNYDAENRKALPPDTQLPARQGFTPDDITHDVISMVGTRFADRYGELDGFSWAVTREEALQALAHFINDCLARFGDYQDAMQTGEDYLYHALISPYLNAGLLLPREVCEAVLEAHAEGKASLSATEGFIRQVLGWREYIRGIYWSQMPAYNDSNHLLANRPLPAFFWTAETNMHCLAQSLDATRRNAYAHHIQRLMIIGNFALLAGLEPAEVEAWYLAVYADAYEWVELPNTHGMVLFADGGLLGSKPYAASGAYINRMSDYCQHCNYRVKDKQGEQACPFNYLYWDFLDRNRDQLSSNPRLAMPYRNLARMSDDKLATVREDARRFLANLESA